MLPKVLIFMATAIAATTIWAGFTQRSALSLRQERQLLYWPRYRTSLSGRYYRGDWQSNPQRSSYGLFRGGGPSAGK